MGAAKGLLHGCGCSNLKRSWSPVGSPPMKKRSTAHAFSSALGGTTLAGITREQACQSLPPRPLGAELQVPRHCSCFRTFLGAAPVLLLGPRWCCALSCHPALAEARDLHSRTHQEAVSTTYISCLRLELADQWGQLHTVHCSTMHPEAQQYANMGLSSNLAAAQTPAL